MANIRTDPWKMQMRYPDIDRDVFGHTEEGRSVERFTLRNRNGAMLRVLTYGATVTELHVPDRNGRFADVVLGFDNLRQYETESPYFGCTVGRVAFRISNAEFRLDGQTVRLPPNNGPHHLHGGARGFSQSVWQAEPLPGEEPAVRFSLVSPNGDQGYPGQAQITAIHILTQENELRIEYCATADRATPINLTHHGYFNLAGSGDILGHLVQVFADRHLVMGAGGIPTGDLASVVGTRYDLRRPSLISDRPDSDGQLGFDLGYLVRESPCTMVTVARVVEPTTGRVMEAATTEPGLVFYTGNMLDGTLQGKGGMVYPRHAGFCLEPGGLPDAVNCPGFPSVILRPGQTYRHTSVYRFSTDTTGV